MADNSDLSDISKEVLKWIKNSLETNNFEDTQRMAKICDLNTYGQRYTIEDVRGVVDMAFKQQTQQLNYEKGLQFGRYENLLRLSILAAKSEWSTGGLPVYLLSDIFDCRTLDECQELFALVENNVDVWKEEAFFKNVKNQMLRSCNDLLRRLSRSQNTVFCGRILIFLARFFPLFERSGLNLISEFNHENTTTFSSQEEGVMAGDAVKAEDQETSEISEKISVDYNFYRKFWQLQDFFRNPVVCYNRTQWKQLQSYTTDVLQAFESFKLDPSSCAAFQVLGEIRDENMYFAKYLTNQKLLELQLSDSNFRRYILIQYLILFQYLTASVRFKQEIHTLSEEQSSWITETTNEVKLLIEETPPNGVEMRKCVDKILKREEFWSNWKNEGCPEHKSVAESEADSKKTEANIRATITRKRRIGDEMRVADANSRILIGNPELNSIWNLCPDNWEACRSKKRLFMPSVEKFFEKAVKAGPELRQELCSNSDFAWRALRLLSQKSNHFFSPSNTVVKTVSSHLEGVVEKLSKEFPSVHQNNSNDFDIDDAEDISDDELLKNVETEQNTAPNTPNTNETQNESSNETTEIPANDLKPETEITT